MLLQSVNVTGGMNGSHTVDPPLMGVHMRVGVVVTPPLIIRSSDTGQVLNNARYTGLIIDVLRAHSTALGFTYTIVEPEDQAYGAKQPDGTYNGLMGLFERGEVDVMYSGLAIDTERARMVAFTQPLLPSGIKILTRRPGAQTTSAWFILSPFTVELWIALLASVLGISGIFYVIDHLSPYGKRQEGNPNWFYHAFGGVLLSVDEFLAVNHQGVASSILTLAWTFAVLAIVTLYTANMMSFLTVQRLKKPVSSIADIATQQVKTGVISSSFTLTWLNANAPTVMPLVTQYKTFDDIITALRAGDVHAALVKSPVADYYAGHTPCDLVTVGPQFATNFIAVGMHPGSTYYGYFNAMVLDQVANGQMDQISEFWLSSKCNASTTANGTGSLGLLDVRGVFYIMAVGVFAALCCLAYQVAVYRCVLRRLGRLMINKGIDDESLLRMITEHTMKGHDQSPTVPARHAKLVLRKLGVPKRDIQVMMAAVDYNGDGWLDLYDLERLQILAKKAHSVADQKVSPLSLTSHPWRLSARHRWDSHRWEGGAFSLRSSSTGRLFENPHHRRSPVGPSSSEDGDRKEGGDVEAGGGGACVRQTPAPPVPPSQMVQPQVQQQQEHQQHQHQQQQQRQQHQQ